MDGPWRANAGLALMATGGDDPKGTSPQDEIAQAIAAGKPIGMDVEADAEPSRKAARTPAGGRKGGRSTKGKAKAGKAAAAAPNGEAAPPKRRRPPQRDSLMALTEDCDLWHDADGDAYATFIKGNHRENWPVRSDIFRRWLCARAYEKTGIVPGSQAVEDTLRVLEARATTEGRQCAPWLRVGAQNGRLYIDLCDESWSVVEIRPNGWDVIAGHSLPFTRAKAMRPLPIPEAGWEISRLRRFVNVATDEDFSLVVAWLVTALRERGPYPILVVNGEQGAGKSTFSRVLRTLVDPNLAPIRSVPKDDRDLIISASNAHVLAYDNLSKVDPWFADGLCRLASGAGHSTRKLTTDRDEAIFMAARPIILNGIPSLTDRADLASRAVTVRLTTIGEDERRAEDDFWEDWENEAPRVFGSLCDALSAAVKNIASVRLDRAPRLADFTKWMTAAEPGLGWEAGTFAHAYGGNRRDVSDNAFEANPVAVALLDHLKGRSEGWEGTATVLLSIINDLTQESIKRLRSWPQTPQALGNSLERCAPLLREKGLHVERRHSGIRTIRIAWIAGREG